MNELTFLCESGMVLVVMDCTLQIGENSYSGNCLCAVVPVRNFTEAFNELTYSEPPRIRPEIFSYYCWIWEGKEDLVRVKRVFRQEKSDKSCLKVFFILKPVFTYYSVSLVPNGARKVSNLVINQKGPKI